MICANAFALSRINFGFFLDLDDFRNDYRSSSTYDEDLAVDYINRINSKAKDNAQEIAQNIYDASTCLGIDAIYLLAKVHQESTFYSDANSKTGAAGLSQMTGVAIQELRDQIGIRGGSYARLSVIKELTENLRSCMGDEEYIEFYKTHKEMTKYQIKQVYKKNIRYSIFAGAIVLKVFLAKNYNPNISLRENYRKSLENYNGEATRALYAQSIIDKAKRIRAEFNAKL